MGEGVKVRSIEGWKGGGEGGGEGGREREGEGKEEWTE